MRVSPPGSVRATRIPNKPIDVLRQRPARCKEQDSKFTTESISVSNANSNSIHRVTGAVMYFQKTYHENQVMRFRRNLCPGWQFHENETYTLQWHHNGCDGVSNHQPHHCLLNRLFRRRSKKTSTICVTCLCVGNSPATCEFPAQMASNVANVSIWWRHHYTIDMEIRPSRWVCVRES